jgi:hypothetical protein
MLLVLAVVLTVGLLPVRPAAALQLAEGYRNSSDFDRDGVPDLLWHNRATGESVIWYMSGADGATLREYRALRPVPDLNWRIAAADDFDGDAIPDLLWRNAATGANVVWYMSGDLGDAYRAFKLLPPVADQTWQIGATGDVDRDGVTDIVWRNAVSGENLVWYMGGELGATLRDYQALPPVADPTWQIVGLTDHDFDTAADIVWRNQASGENVIWYMDGELGATLRDSISLTPVADPTWQIAGVGDFNRDSSGDLLWRNGASGVNVLWHMAFASAAPTSFVEAGPTVAAPNWQIARSSYYFRP